MAMHSFIEDKKAEAKTVIENGEATTLEVVHATRHYVHSLMAMLNLAKNELPEKRFNSYQNSLKGYDKKLWAAIQRNSFEKVSQKIEASEFGQVEPVVKSIEDIQLYSDESVRMLCEKAVEKSSPVIGVLKKLDAKNPDADLLKKRFRQSYKKAIKFLGRKAKAKDKSFKTYKRAFYRAKFLQCQKDYFSTLGIKNGVKKKQLKRLDRTTANIVKLNALIKYVKESGLEKKDFQPIIERRRQAVVAFRKETKKFFKSEKITLKQPASSAI